MLNRAAFSRYSGSSFNNSAYSFMLEPQPADDVMMRSTPEAISESMLVRAMNRLLAMSPAWAFSAPQHPWPGGTTTSQPLRVNTRTVASMVGPCIRGMTQPDSSATVIFFSPCALWIVFDGTKNFLLRGGSWDSSPAIPPGSKCNKWDSRSSFCSPNRW